MDHLHDGHGEFADHLPPLLLADIARRATDVWLHAPHRLPAPAESAVAATAPNTPCHAAAPSLWAEVPCSVSRERAPEGGRG